MGNPHYQRQDILAPPWETRPNIKIPFKSWVASIEFNPLVRIIYTVAKVKSVFEKWNWTSEQVVVTTCLASSRRTTKPISEGNVVLEQIRLMGQHHIPGPQVV